MKKLILILAFILLPVWVWGATYYVRTAGHDTNCNGTADVDDSEGVRPACAWATVGKGVATMPNSADHTLNVAAGDYMAEAAATSTVASGITHTIQFAGASTIRLVENSASYTSLYTINGAGKLHFKGAGTGATKNLIYDLGKYGAGAGTNHDTNARIFAPTANSGIFEINDAYIHANGATTKSSLTYAANARTGASFIAKRCKWSHGPAAAPLWDTDHALWIEANYIVSPFYRIALDDATPASFVFIKNTLYATTANDRLQLNYATTAKVRVEDNLFIVSTDIAVDASYFPINVEADHTDFNIRGNVAWKLAFAALDRTTTTRAQKHYPYIYYSNNAPDFYGNNLIVIDPDMVSATDSPEINTTSLLIGNGQSGETVTTGYNGVAYASNSIGCWATTTSRNIITPTSKKVLVVGDSFASSSGGVGYRIEKLEVDANMAAYSFVRVADEYVSFPGEPAYELNGAVSELAQQFTPQIIIYAAGINDLGSFDNDRRIASIRGFFDSTHHLYNTNKIHLIYLGAQPSDSTGIGTDQAAACSSVTTDTTNDDALEANITAYIAGRRNFHSVSLTGAMAAASATWPCEYYTVGDNVHPNSAGFTFIETLLEDIILNHTRLAVGGNLMLMGLE